MSSPATQIKVSLPNPLYDYLSSRAARFGLPLSTYVKNLIINDVKDLDYPTYQASVQTEMAYRQARQDRPHAVVVGDVKQFFSDL